MPREPKSIRESSSELRRLIRRYGGTDRERPLRMTLLFCEQPDLSFAAAADLLQISKSTVRRWYARYHHHGIDGILDLHPHNRPSSAPVTNPAMTPGVENQSRSSQSSSSTENSLLPSLIEFLRHLPMMDDSVEFCLRMREAIIDLFDDVDYAVVEVETALDLFDPGSNQPSTIYREHVHRSSRGESISTVRESTMKAKGPQWYQLYQQGLKQYPDLDTKFSEPEGFDYEWFAPGAYLGAILLFRRSGQPRISDETISMMENLAPFFRYVLSDHVARRRLRRPFDPLFRDLSARIDPESRLSKQEQAVIQLAFLGHSNKEIALLRSISIKTVQRHIENAFKKIGAASFRELFSLFIMPRNQYDPRTVR